MGAIGTAIESVREIIRGISTPRVKGQRFAGDTLLADLYAPSGDDSPPLPDDIVFFSRDSTTGGLVYLGAIDQNNPTEAAPGEKRLYARTPAGAIATELWLKGDGTIEIAGSSDFAVRFDALQAALTALEIQLLAHIHPGVATGSGSTGTSATIFDADISAAKVDEVKLP
jgi:hypothetical protein